MPGIFGNASLLAEVDHAARLRAMADSMRHHPWYQEELFEDAQAGVGMGRLRLDFQGPDLQIGHPGESEIVALVDGEIYDANAQRQALRSAGYVVKDASQGALVAAGYAAMGDAFFRGLHGKFAAVVWDRRRRKLTLLNDRFGMRPLYYAWVGGQLHFASEIKALLTDSNISRQSNLCGIAQFFTFGQLLSEDTLLDSVRVLPAAGCLTYDLRDDCLNLTRYWQLAGTRSVNDSATLDRIVHAFTQAVRRCTVGTPNLGLSLSGGLDSRTILGVMDDHQQLTTVCLGMPGSADHRAAVEMARLTNRHHHQCLLGAGFLERFEDHLRHMVRITDGHYLSQCIVMPTLPLYRELGIQVLLRGHAGELMHMRKAYNFSLDREAMLLHDDAGLESWLLGHLQAYLLEGVGYDLFAARHRGHMEGLARDSLHNCLSESSGVQPPVHRIWHMFLSQRLRRETAMSLVKFGSQVETRVPYLDNELIDALFAAPVDLKLGENIQAQILTRHRPSFLKVTNVNTGAAMSAGRVGTLIGSLRQRVLAKLGVRGYQPYERLGLWLRRELQPLVQRILLADECLDRGLFEPAMVKTVLADHFQGKNRTFLLMAMMTYELGQRELNSAKDDLGSNRERVRPAPAVTSV